MAQAPGSTNRVGLIAGWGRYPILVARRLKERGVQVCCLGVRDHADPVLQDLCHEFSWIGLGRIGGVIRYFRRHGVREATMAGKIHKVRLFERGAWLRHLPDWKGFWTYYPHVLTRKKTMQDDSLLLAITHAFSRAGITMKPATDFVPELLVRPACLTARRPTAAQQQDIDFGWRLAKEMGRLDIGQCVAVKDRSPLAIEAIEGTDECIRRAGQLCKVGGFTVVKVAKPQQDMRFDVPTVGLGTLESLVAAGGRVLAIEAGRTIVIDEPQVIEYAERHKLVIVSLDENSQTRSQAA